MLRKPPIEDDEQHERWLVSYADFITLLFAFFVVMYSISQVNEGKYKILSESLVAAFDSPERSLLPIQEGDINRSSRVADVAVPINEPSSGAADDNDSQTDSEEGEYASDEEFENIRSDLEERLANLIKNDLVDIKASKNWLEINLRSRLLFQSGSHRLGRNAAPVLEEIVLPLLDNRHQINVRGHTDNIPIDTERFGSNWELSAARSVAVVQLLQTLTIAPERMTAEGHGEFQPVASNSSADGRAKNRRVTIAISRYKTPGPKQEDNKLPERANSEENVAEKTSEKAAPTAVEEDKEPTYEVVKLPGGGLLIRGKTLPERDDQK